MACVRTNRGWIIAFLIAGLALLCGVAQAQTGTGSIVGTVRGPTGDALARVSVTVTGTNLETSTNFQGVYRIVPVPAGEHTVVFSYIGLGATTGTVTVAAGQAATLDVKLSYSEAVQVSGSPIIEGQAKALNTQENLLNIANVVASDQMSQFPDPNAAEATQRLPAVSLLRDQGEGRYVLIRGTEPRLNSTTVNGERLPASEAGVRNIALDTVPADLLESIQVSKALTPDMDGDAIGGTVDLVTKRAPLEARTQASIGGGYSAIAKDYIELGTFTFGRRFDQGKTGLLMTLSANKANRGSDDYEPTYSDGYLDELMLRDYTLSRERYGFAGSLDRQLSNGAEMFVRAVWDEYRDTELRRNMRNQVSDERITRELRDRTQSSRLTSLTAGGSAMAGETVITYRAAWNKSKEWTPDQVTSSFRQKSVLFDPNVSPTSIDPNNIQANPTNQDVSKFKFNSIETQWKSAQEEDYVGSVDVTRAFYRDTSFSGLWKVGAKARFKTKTQGYEVYDYESEETLYLSDYLSGWAPDTPFISGRYTLGPFQDPGKMRQLLASGALVGAKNLAEDMADFDMDENVLAGYAMGEFDIGANLMLLAGVRAENTKNTYTAYQIVYDEEGNPAGVSPVKGDKNYTEVLPMVHLKYKLGEHSNLRVAVTRSFARPNFGDIAPYELIDYSNEEIERGNATLKPTTSWNYDLLFEHYLASVGIVSAGAFYKQLENNIFLSALRETIDATEFWVTQPINAERGWLRGFEFAYQNRFASLPSPFDGLGLYLNYTYGDSKSSYPNRPDTQLAGQAKHVGNLAVSYEKGGFSGRVSVNYNGKSIFAVGDAPETDQWVDNHTQLDLSAQQRISDKMSLFLEVINLTNEPYRIYEGSTNRPLQEEYYRWWGTIGLKLNF
jgi:TonB-dependent receptor